MRLAMILAGFVMLLPPQPAPLGDTEPIRRPDRRVALTFDDLPMTGPACDADAVREVTARLTGLLKTRALPAAGLATPGRECLDPDILSEALVRWRDVGAIIGNHTATHPDLNSTSIADYLSDIERAQALIDRAVRTDHRWFRPPYLHSGADARKKGALTGYLIENGYRLAPVTIDNQEWVYAAVYADARHRRDVRLARRVTDAYTAHLEDAIAFYERLSISLFDREIPQILLLHANLLNAEHLHRLIDMLGGRGYRFIGLPEAVDDPAYALEDAYVGPRGLSWLQRWALKAGVAVPNEPREAPWVAEAFRAMRAHQSQSGIGRRRRESSGAAPHGMEEYARNPDRLSVPHRRRGIGRRVAAAGRRGRGAEDHRGPLLPGARDR